MKKYLIIFLTLFAFVIALPQVDARPRAALTDNLVSYWRLNEASGTRFDAYGTNDLTDNNTVGQGTGIIDEAADFERNNSEYLSIADGSQSGLDITSDLSISVWLNPETASVAQHFVAKHNTGGDQRSYRFYATGANVVGCELSSDGTSISAATTTSSSISAGAWYHLACVYNGTDIRIYINGSLASNGSNNPLSYSSGIFNSSADFALGRRQSADHLDGLLDEAAIWSRALTAQEVIDLYNSGAGLDILGSPTPTPTPTPTNTSTPNPTNTPGGPTSTPTPTPTPTPGGGGGSELIPQTWDLISISSTLAAVVFLVMVVLNVLAHLIERKLWQ